MSANLVPAKPAWRARPAERQRRCKFLKSSQKLRVGARRVGSGLGMLPPRSPPRAAVPCPRLALERMATASNNIDEVRTPMLEAALAPSAVAPLFVVSFLCFMGGAALRRWPEKVQAYMEDVDGSFQFVSANTHRALIQATSVALTGLSLLALVAARFV